MRATHAWRLLAAALLLLTMLAALPATLSPVPVVAFADDDGDDDSGEGNDDEDDDDEDHDNQGKQNEQQDKEKGNQGKDDDAVAAAGYAMEVTCEPVADAAQTTCAFHAVAPPDGKKVNHVLVPDGLACAEVAGGDARFVDPDPNIHVTGYRATHDTFTMVFAGTVEPGGVATYWVKAASGVYPATGPGLACLGAESLAPASTPAATPPPVTGTLTVVVYACPAVEPGATEVDWFGICVPDSDGLRFVLASAEAGDGALYAAETIPTGMATFSGLPPGSYDLDDPDRRWIYAESDHVTADGTLLVEAGATTTVWLFYGEE